MTIVFNQLTADYSSVVKQKKRAFESSAWEKSNSLHRWWKKISHFIEFLFFAIIISLVFLMI